MEASEAKSSYDIFYKDGRWKVAAVNPQTPLDLDFTVTAKGDVYEGNITLDGSTLKLSAKRKNSNGKGQDVSLSYPFSGNGEGVHLHSEEHLRKSSVEPHKTEDVQPTVAKYSERDLAPYMNSFQAAPYALRIKKLMREDDVIPFSAIKQLSGSDRIRFSLTLNSLAKKHTKPVERTDIGYRVVDREIFDKIVAVGAKKTNQKN